MPPSSAASSACRPSDMLHQPVGLPGCTRSRWRARNTCPGSRRCSRQPVACVAGRYGAALLMDSRPRRMALTLPADLFRARGVHGVERDLRERGGAARIAGEEAWSTPHGLSQALHARAGGVPAWATAWLVRDQPETSPPPAQDASAGASLFERHCRSCHSASGLRQTFSDGEAACADWESLLVRDVEEECVP